MEEKEEPYKVELINDPLKMRLSASTNKATSLICVQARILILPAVLKATLLN